MAKQLNLCASTMCAVENAVRVINVLTTPPSPTQSVQWIRDYLDGVFGPPHIDAPYLGDIDVNKKSCDIEFWLNGDPENEYLVRVLIEKISSQPVEWIPIAATGATKKPQGIWEWKEGFYFDRASGEITHVHLEKH